MALALLSVLSLTFSATSLRQRLQPELDALMVGRRAAILAAGAAATSVGRPRAALAADDVAKARDQMASSAAELDSLLKDWDAVVEKDGGNGVRRVLGKLGPTSPLHRVDKAASLVACNLDDERTFDIMDDFLGQVDAADGDAYSSIFVPTGGGTTPEYWLARSKKEVAKARSTLGQFLELQ